MFRVRPQTNPQFCWIGFTLAATAALSLPSRSSEPVEIVRELPANTPKVQRVTALTCGPKQHFFGYYGVNPWDSTGRRLACIEVDVGDRLVATADLARICILDEATGALNRVAETHAWNLQQGAMLFWINSNKGSTLTFNDRVDGRLATVFLDPDGRRHVADRALAAIAHDGKSAISVNFDRLRAIRPVTGYAGGPKLERLDPRPKDDGLFFVDLMTGRSRLLVSIDQCWRLRPLPEGLSDQPFWIEHPVFNADDSRVFFILRAFHAKSRAMFSLALCIHRDGGDLKSLLPWGAGSVSHFDWLDDKQVALTGLMRPKAFRHILLDVENGTSRELAPNELKSDGHCCFSPDRKWMVTDSYPDKKRRQHLFVMNVQTGSAYRLASFHTPEQYRSDWRCDLHPRWHADSRRICIDSTHSGIRQVYVVELAMP